jgi:hypothetical protein
MLFGGPFSDQPIQLGQFALHSRVIHDGISDGRHEPFAVGFDVNDGVLTNGCHTQWGRLKYRVPILDRSAIAEHSNRVDLKFDFVTLASGEDLFVGFLDRCATDVTFTFIADELAIGSPERCDSGCIAAIERLFKLGGSFADESDLRVFFLILYRWFRGGIRSDWCGGNGRVCETCREKRGYEEHS